MKRTFVTGLAALLLCGTAQAATEVKIGFLSTLSGPSAAIGLDIRDGFTLFLQQNGGKLGGLPAEVVVADDQQNADTGKQLIERLLKKDRVDLVTGIVFTNVMLAVAPAVFDAQTFLISANATPSRVLRRRLQPLVLQRVLAERRRARGGGQVRDRQGLQQRRGDRAQLSGREGRHHRLQALLQGCDQRRDLLQARPARLRRRAGADPRGQAPGGVCVPARRDGRELHQAVRGRGVEPDRSCWSGPASPPTRTSSRRWASPWWACTTPRSGRTTSTTRRTSASSPTSRSSISACRRCTPRRATTRRS